MAKDAKAVVDRKDDALFPLWLRASASVLFLVVGGLALYALLRFDLGHVDKNHKPSDLGLDKIVIMSLIGLVGFHVPWRKIGSIVSEAGPIKFRDVLKTQANEQLKVSARIEARISALEKAAKASHRSSEIGEISDNSVDADSDDTELPMLLEDFLSHNQQDYFSAAQIRELGLKQQGFQKMGQYDAAIIDRQLRQMLLAGTVTTRISAKGAIQYGLS